MITTIFHTLFRAKEHTPLADPGRMDGRSRRGSALVATLVFAGLMAVVVLYMYSSTMNTASVSSLRENRDTAAAAADLAVEVAVTNLSNIELLPPDSGAESVEGAPVEQIVARDWVRSEPYYSSNSDQRRIGGAFVMNGENVDYRVLVRSLRDARNYGTKPESWLKGMDDEGEDAFVFGDSSMGQLRKFTGTYEITSSAKTRAHAPEPLFAPRTRGANRAADGGPADPLSLTASSKTLVTLQYRHPLNTQEQHAVVNSDDLGTLNPTPDMKVSGEDHYSVASVIQHINQVIKVVDTIDIPISTSTLQDVMNHSWNTGEQTLHFQRDPEAKAFNPHIPRTVDYSTESIDKRMVALDGTNPLTDKFLFGGKRYTGLYYRSLLEQVGDISYWLTYGYGRSVSFAEGDEAQSVILEDTAPAQTEEEQWLLSPFAIGAFEDIGRVYLNHTVSPALKTSTSEAIKYDTTHPADDASEEEVSEWKRGWSQLPLTYHSKAKTKAGQERVEVLLDSKASPAKRHKASKFFIKNEKGQWLGRDYRYEKKGPLVGGVAYTPPDDWDGYYTWYDEAAIHYQLICWFTAVPYMSASTPVLIHLREFTMEELTGFQVTKGPDGIPAKLDEGGNVVGGSPAFILDQNGEKIPYVLTVNGNETQFDEGAQRLDTADNHGIRTGNVDDPRYPRRDGIYIVERDAEGNRVLDADGKLKVTVCRTMEDFYFDVNLAEENEEDDWRKMALVEVTLEMTPEEHKSTGTPDRMYGDFGVTVAVIDPLIKEEESKVNIYEGMERFWWEGPAEESLTDRRSHYAVTARPTEEVRRAATDEAKLDALYDYGFGAYSGGETEGIFTMVGGDGERAVFKRAVFETDSESADFGLMRNRDEDAPGGTYYVTRDDLYRILSGMVALGSLSDPDADPETLLPEAMTYVHSRNPGYTFRPVAERYAAGTEYDQAAVARERPSALGVTDKYVTSRAFAGEVFGMMPQEVRGRHMLRRDGGALEAATNADAGLGGDSAGYPAPVTVKLPFLPFERLIDPSDTGYLADSSEFVPFINTNHNTVQYNGQELKPRFMTPELFQYAIRQAPDWLDENGLLEDFGKREAESRSGIGWHRRGPKFDDPLMSDHYEYIVAGKPGFMPYLLVPGTGEVALVREQSSSMTEEEIARREFKPLLRNPREMPTFVIGGDAVDGAGILVVNGNLEIRTEFAYSGTLVVMGDLIMRPTELGVPKRDENGFVVDAEGNVLLNDKDGYYYNKDGNRVDAVPEMVRTLTSKLVLQGQVFLGGSVRNMKVNGVMGKLDIRGSSGAMEDVTGSMFDGREKREVSRLLHGEADSQGEIDELWATGM